MEWTILLIKKWLVWTLHKKNILRKSASKEFTAKVFPAKNQMAEMEALVANAYFLSNGPDQRNGNAVATYKDILD